MKRSTAAAIAIVVILACLIVAYADAGKPGAFVRYTVSSKTVVEQQSVNWTHNDCAPVTTICNVLEPRAIWDVDDIYHVIFGGTLRPGQSISFSLPLVIDTKGHFLAIDTSEGVTGSVAVGEAVSRCLVGPKFDHASELPPLPNADGGTGYLDTVTWTVRNDTARPQKFQAFGHVSPPHSEYFDECPWPWTAWERGGQVPAYTAPTWYWHD